MDAHVDVALFFPIFGTGDINRVNASTTSLYSDKTIEVAMMLDVTGSMAGQKIKDLRTAAANAVDSFLGSQDPSKPRVRVSIVPYANSVNAGQLAASTVYVEANVSQRKQAPGNASAQSASASTRSDIAPPNARVPISIRTLVPIPVWSIVTICCRPLPGIPGPPLVRLLRLCR